MGKKIDLAGKTFGRWTVISEGGRKNKRIMWRCQCSCGTEKEVSGCSLQTGHSTSCGCKRNETLQNKAIHGKNRRGSRSPIYGVWAMMIQRCRNKKDKKYRLYGDRGITVCERWLTFKSFYEDMGDAPVIESGERLQIDRINNDKGYCKENCRWATRSQQMKNRDNAAMAVLVWKKRRELYPPTGYRKNF